MPSHTAERRMRAVELARRAREKYLRVVFTNGCFDLLHHGHVATLEFAKSLGDVLIVAINSDRSVRRLKGEGRPIFPLKKRAAMLAALGWVDCVTAFSEDAPVELIRAIRPDVLVKGAEYRGSIVPGGDFAGRVEFAPMIPGISTTGVVTRMRSAHCEVL